MIRSFQSISPSILIFLLSSSLFSFFFFYLKTVPLQDLANSSSILEEEECNKRVVHALYEALNAGDVVTVQQLLAPDIEWWFHGPPSYQYLMQLLTGNSLEQRFEFVQQKITAFGSTVLAEGRSPDNKVSWVHAWTVNNGVITQVREYFNTSLLVTRLDHSSSPSSSSSSSFHYLPRLWESTLSGGKSMPGLVLAI